MFRAFANLWRMAPPEVLAGIAAAMIVIAAIVVVMLFIAYNSKDSGTPTYTGGPTALGTPSPGLTMGGFNFGTLGSNMPSAPGAYGTPNTPFRRATSDYSDILPGGWRGRFIVHGMRRLRIAFFVISFVILAVALSFAIFLGGKFWAVPVLAMAFNLAHALVWIRNTPTGHQRVFEFLMGSVVFASPEEPAAQLGPTWAPFCTSEMYTAGPRLFSILFGTGRSLESGEISLSLYADDDGNLPMVDREPIFAIWNGNKDVTNSTALEKAVTTTPVLLLRGCIYDPIRVLIVAGSLKSAIHLIKAVMVRSLNDKAGNIAISEATRKIPEISESILEAVENAIGDPDAVAKWHAEHPGERYRGSTRLGVDVKEASLVAIGTSKTYNEGLVNQATTQMEGEAAAANILRAKQAEARGITATGDAERDARMARAEGDSVYLEKTGTATANNLAAQARALAENPEARFIAGLDVWGDAIKNGKNVTLFSGGGGNNGQPDGLPPWIVAQMGAALAAGMNTQNPNRSQTGGGTTEGGTPSGTPKPDPKTPPTGGGGGQHRGRGGQTKTPKK